MASALKHRKKQWAVFSAAVFAALVFCAAYFFLPSLSVLHYDAALFASSTEAVIAAPKPWKATHVKTPVPLYGVYMTSWVAGNVGLRTPLVSLAESTEINAIVIDIKDYSGRIAFKTDNTLLAPALENRIHDLR